MNLLPKDHHEFVEPAYWNQFFKKRGAQAFEWYGEYPDLCGVLHKYIKPKDRLLVVGCGNSQLSADLYDVGYRQIVNIDISDVVIRQMTDKNRKQRPDMVFQKMDVFNMEYGDGEFSVVLDKGTLDALMVSDSEEVVRDVERMFNEIDRVLKLMGRYVCISLLQEHILRKAVHFFADKGWALRIHRIHKEMTEKEFQLPVFALIFTKFKKNPGMPQILEVCSVDEKVERLTTEEDLINLVREMQCYAMIRHQLTEKKQTEAQVSVCLYGDLVTSPRYVLTIVDSDIKLPRKFAIFIVPEGRKAERRKNERSREGTVLALSVALTRNLIIPPLHKVKLGETEWLFSSDEGRLQLAAGANFERLLVVTLDRNHTYHSMDTIKAELSSKVMELAPPGFNPTEQVPFLSLGNDSLGERIVQARGTSDLSGEYVIEDVLGDEGIQYRRLVFLTTQNIVQSETRLVLVKVKKKGKGKKHIVPDKSYLACQHHVAMVAGISMVLRDDFQSLLDTRMSLLLIGLGGGGLPIYIHKYFPQMIIDCVDIDPTIVSIATEWFGFHADDKMKAHVADGLEFIKDEVVQGKKRHVLMLDVDSKDVAVGMSCPPQLFVEPDFLKQTKELLHPGGLLILNLVCRDPVLREEVINRVKTVFPYVYIQGIEEEVNRVLYCLNLATDMKQDELMQRISDNVKCMNRLAKQAGRSPEHDLVEKFQGLELL